MVLCRVIWKLWEAEHGRQSFSYKKNPICKIKKSPCFQNVGNIVLTWRPYNHGKILICPLTCSYCFVGGKWRYIKYYSYSMSVATALEGSFLRFPLRFRILLEGLMRRDHGEQLAQPPSATLESPLQHAHRWVPRICLCTSKARQLPREQKPHSALTPERWSL